MARRLARSVNVAELAETLWVVNVLACNGYALLEVTGLSPVNATICAIVVPVNKTLCVASLVDFHLTGVLDPRQNVRHDYAPSGS